MICAALLAVLSGNMAANAEENENSRFLSGVKWELETELSLSQGEHTPFWLTANRYGLGSAKKNEGFVRAEIEKKILLGTRRVEWGFGADLVGSWRSEAPFLARQLYVAAAYRAFEVSLGSRIFHDRLVNQRLSTGDMVFSGNSLPIPQLRIEMPRYLNVPGFNGWWGLKGYFSYGIFSDSRWQKTAADTIGMYNNNVLFHSKGIRFRIGRPNKFPLELEFGLDHAAQFGGKVMIGDSVVADFPNGVKDFFKVLIPMSGGDDSPKVDQTNITGNHVGEWSARLNYTPSTDWGISLYWLHYFDDQSMIFWEYPWKDGLWGVEAKLPRNRFVSAFVYEYLNTCDQSGPVYWDKTDLVPVQVSGRDDYYNHVTYRGWQHWGMGIGNPMVLSPVYYSDSALSFKCNRIKTHHFAMEGSPLEWLDYRLILSYTRGWGTYKRPLSTVLSNFNMLLEAGVRSARLPGWKARVAVGIDRGGLLGHSFGASLTVSRSGIL